MWHRFDQPLRDVVLAALRCAATSGRATAETGDFATAIRDSSAAPQATAANAISPAALEKFEAAYVRAAQLGDRTIRVEHLAAELGISAENDPRDPPRAPAQVPPLCVLNPQFSIDPYPLYRQLREFSPVRRDPLLSWWIVTGYPEAVQVLRDRRFSSTPRSNRTASGTMELERLPRGPVRRDLAVVAGVVSGQVVFMDPPAHTRVRMRLGEVFSIPAAESMRQRAAAISDELLEAVRPQGRMDLISDFAYPLPLRVVSEMMGFSREDESLLKRWSDVFSATLAFNMSLADDLETRRCILEMRTHFDRIIRNSKLAKLMEPALGGGDAIEPEEMFANIGFLLAAGHETTTSTLGSGVRALLSHPDQLSRLRENPALIPAAVEELLRYESPVQWTGRRATEDIEIGGERIRKGEIVLISLGAANRDPRQFPDPDRLDITRPNAAKHLAFSGGAHYCLGASLGRIELNVGLEKLLQLRNLRIAPDVPQSWRMGSALRGLRSLSVLFD